MNLREKIAKLRKERNAVILAHNYQNPEVQDAADFVGDSLGLSFQAARTDAAVIVFCGVHFMAETAKILSPGKTVLLPDPDAGCPMADMITAEDLRDLKREHPRARVLCYVNTSAAVKAESDFCCTSANAETMVREALAGEGEILFVPDRHLAGCVSERTGRTLIAWNGFCPTHARILPGDIERAGRRHPGAAVLAHPECTAEVRALADLVASTEGMCRYAKEAAVREFIVATETGILHRMRKESPGKAFHPAAAGAVCPNMKRITLEKVLRALEEGVHEIVVPEEIAARARGAIDRMLRHRGGERSGAGP
jgi:quinolinate synthase